MTVTTENGESRIRKSRLWLLQNDRIKISTDIAQRFIPKKSITIKAEHRDNSIWKDEEISRGDCIIITQNKNLLLGCALNFQKANETMKSKKLYPYDVAKVEQNNLQVILDPIYIILNDYNFVEIPSNHLYYVSNSFICMSCCQ